MSETDILQRLSSIEARIAVIETNLKWIQGIFRLILIGLTTLTGVNVYGMV